jgi:hypothetical protein
MRLARLTMPPCATAGATRSWAAIHAQAVMDAAIIHTEFIHTEFNIDRLFRVY